MKKILFVIVVLSLINMAGTQLQAGQQDRIQIKETLTFPIDHGNVNYFVQKEQQVWWTMQVYVYVKVLTPTNGNFSNVQFTISMNGHEDQNGMLSSIGPDDGLVPILRADGSETWSVYPADGSMRLTALHSDTSATQGRIEVTVSTSPLDRQGRLQIKETLTFPVNNGQVNYHVEKEQQTFWTMTVYVYARVIEPVAGEFTNVDFTIAMEGYEDQTGTIAHISAADGQVQLMRSDGSTTWKVYPADGSMDLKATCTNSAVTQAKIEVIVSTSPLEGQPSRLQITETLTFPINNGVIDYFIAKEQQTFWTMHVYVYVKVIAPQGGQYLAANGPNNPVEFTLSFDGHPDQHGHFTSISPADGLVQIDPPAGQDTWTVYPADGSLRLRCTHSDTSATQGQVEVTVSTTPLK